MATEAEKSTLQSQYEAQFADHLAKNREEQARLRKRLEQLVVDEVWLVKALEAVAGPAGAGAQASEGESVQLQDHTSEPAEPADLTEPTVETAPEQGQDTPTKAPAKKTTAKKTVAKKTTAKKAPAAKKQAGKKTPVAKKSAAKAGEPTLGEVLLDILDRHAGQPRTASEVVSDLEREYPERARDINTVRNTLERLVAKSRVERSKQKNTVLYTAVTSSAPGADAPAPEASPAAETADAEGTEKAPAQA